MSRQSFFLVRSNARPSATVPIQGMVDTLVLTWTPNLPDLALHPSHPGQPLLCAGFSLLLRPRYALSLVRVYRPVLIPCTHQAAFVPAAYAAFAPLSNGPRHMYLVAFPTLLAAFRYLPHYLPRPCDVQPTPSTIRIVCACGPACALPVSSTFTAPGECMLSNM